jgi:hypothetical protein
MKKFLLINNRNLDSALELCLAELKNKQFTITEIASFSEYENIANRNFDVILINSINEKLSTLDFIADFKNINDTNLYVYLPKVSGPEASKFGLNGAAVEDQHSISSFVERAGSQSPKNQKSKTFNTCFLNLNGQAGTSSSAILLSIFLKTISLNSVIVDLADNKGLSHLLDLGDNSALLEHEANNQDESWLNTFMCQSKNSLLILNAFNQLHSKHLYKEKHSQWSNEASKHLDFLINNYSYDHQIKIEDLEYIQNYLNASRNFINMSDVNFTLELNQLLSKYCKNLIFDLGADIHSHLNQEVLNKADKIYVCAREEQGLNESYSRLKDFLLREFDKPCSLILNLKNSNPKLIKQSENTWLSYFNEVPFLMPYEEKLPFLIKGEVAYDSSNKINSYLNHILADLNAGSVNNQTKTKKYFNALRSIF